MVKKIKNNDFLIKLLSILLSVGIWFYVAYAENPDIEIWFHGVSLSYLHDDALSANDLVRNKEDVTNTVSLKIRGNRQELLALSSHDISAYVNLEEITSASTYSLPINAKFPYSGPEIVDKKPYNIQVKIENIITATHNLEVNFEGAPAKGCTIENYTSSVESVTIQGPKSIIERVEKCVAVVDTEGLSSNKTTPAKIFMYAKDGTQIESSDISLSNTHTSVTFTVNMSKTVPVTANYQNHSNAEIKEIGVEPGEITVSGPSAVINAISTISTKQFEITDVNTKTYNMPFALPEGVKSNTNNATIQITFK